MGRQIFRLEHNFRHWLFGLDRYKKRLIQITFDGFLAVIMLLSAFFMRLETIDFLYRLDTYVGVLIALVSALTVFALKGQYNNFTRHISVDTAYSIAFGSAVSCIILFISIFVFKLEIPRSVPLIYAALLCLFATSIRFLIRALGQNMFNKQPENVAIYGTGADSVQLMEALRKNADYDVKVLIDNNLKMQGQYLGGVPISKLDDSAVIIRKLEIETLLFTVPSDIHEIRNHILQLLSDYPLKIKAIPNISSLISGQTKISELKDIKIEDLLGRKPAESNPELMAKTIAGKTVFVTGAGGSIGSELCQQIIFWKPRRLILLDISEYAIYKLIQKLELRKTYQDVDLIPMVGSVQDRQFIKKIFQRFAIDTTYHAAAYKHVPLMEQNVMQCFANNVFGTLNMAELSIVAGVKNFVLISTDKAVNPTNFMGASKRFAEIICKTLSTENVETCFSIVRFGNVLGSSGSVVPLFKKQIEEGGPITLTHIDVTRYFMTISEASQLVIQAASIAKGGDIFVLDMGVPIKLLDLAKRMATLSGLAPILNGKEKLNDNEIAIIVTGLRPGEKLFEELTYSPNLGGTVHPKINTSIEKSMDRLKLQSLLTAASDAIRDYDHKKLYGVIAQVTKGVADVESSNDVFINEVDEQSDQIVNIQLPDRSYTNLISD